MMKVYLCGGINGLPNSDCMDWRERAKKILGEENCIDPMRRDFRGIEGAYRDYIIESDKEDIDNAGILLVNATKPSWGTAMEIFYFAQSKRLSVAFTGKVDAISPWLSYHINTICETEEEAIQLCKSWRR